jgi:peptidoglycan/xylan/chitin deacetylase (PgdA/CDA1 family)
MTLRETIAPTAKTALFRLGTYAALRRISPSRHAAILRYHAVCGPEGHRYASPAICVAPDVFEQQVAYIAAHYRVLPLDDVVGAMQAGRSLPPNTVVFTFDDGYADNLQAARVLHRHGITGTFYITAGCLAGELPFWPAEIHGLLPYIRTGSMELTAAGRPVTIPLGTPDDRRRAPDRLARIMKSNPIRDREDVREQLRALAGRPALPNAMLRWDEVREMHRLGMTIGAHTLTHPNLPSAGLPDATREIAGSKQRIEAELDAPVRQFSYPNGGAERYYTPELQHVVRKAGFDAAATSRNGFAALDSDRYALKRVRIGKRLADLIFGLEVERFAFAPADQRPVEDPSVSARVEEEFVRQCR